MKNGFNRQQILSIYKRQFQAVTADWTLDRWWTGGWLLNRLIRVQFLAMNDSV